MGRGRVQLKRIENKVNQQVTFSKRRSGLLKKAREISVLCDADVGLIIFSTKGKLFEYATDSCMERILDRYQTHLGVERQLRAPDLESPASLNLEHAKLKARMEVLQRNQRNIMGDDLDSLTLKELQNLEHQVDASLKKIRSRNNQLMRETISDLQKQDKALQERNNLLAMKIKERAKELESVAPSEQQNNNTTLSCINILRPLNTLTDSETCQAPGEINEQAEGTPLQTQPSNSTMVPWMLHHIRGSE